MHQVIVWNNSGARRVLDVPTEAEAIKVARTERTMGNRTVKIAHGGQAWYHWSRSVHLNRNHWCARAVHDEYLTS